jgi:hypothetical protein
LLYVSDPMHKDSSASSLPFIRLHTNTAMPFFLAYSVRNSTSESMLHCEDLVRGNRVHRPVFCGCVTSIFHSTVCPHWLPHHAPIRLLRALGAPMIRGYNDVLSSEIYLHTCTTMQLRREVKTMLPQINLDTRTFNAVKSILSLHGWYPRTSSCVRTIRGQEVKRRS